MAVAIRGTTPDTASGAGDPISLTLTGSRQPNAGDVLIIIHTNDFYALSNMPTPTVGGSSTGVTSIVDADRGSSDGHAKTWYYVVGSTGDLTVAVDETGSADEEKALIVYVLSGADTSTPIDVSASDVTGAASVNQVAPSVSPTSSDAYLICHINTGPQNSGAYTPPGSMTESYDFVVNSNACGNTGGTQQLSASGATGTRTFVAANNTNWLGISIAVKTATGGAAPESSAYQIAKLPGRIGPDGKVFTPGIRFDNNGAVVEITGTVVETQDNQTSAATGVLSYTGTVAETQDNQTSTASGVLGYSGTAVGTQANQTSSASGTLGYSGTVVETQDNQTSTASGSVAGGGEVTGAVAETQDNQTSTTTGVLGYTGTSARIQANQTSTATGWITITGTVAEVQDAQTSTASGVLRYSGSVASIQTNQAATASGWILVTGLAVETQDNQTIDATGFVGEIPIIPEVLTLDAAGPDLTLSAVKSSLTLEALED